jgi:hypothetical protein
MIKESLIAHCNKNSRNAAGGNGGDSDERAAEDGDGTQPTRLRLAPALLDFLPNTRAALLQARSEASVVGPRRPFIIAHNAQATGYCGGSGLKGGGGGGGVCTGTWTA